MYDIGTRLIPVRLEALMDFWINHVPIKRLLFLMDVARFSTVALWVILCFGAARDVKAYKVSLDSDAATRILEERVSELKSNQKDLVLYQSELEKAVTDLKYQFKILEAENKLLAERVERSEAFWTGLKDKFWWAVIGQIGVLFVWFLLGHDLRKRIAKKVSDDVVEA